MDLAAIGPVAAPVLEFAKEAGVLPAAMLLYVLLQLRTIKASISALPCRVDTKPGPPVLREVPDECKDVASGR